MGINYNKPWDEDLFLKQPGFYMESRVPRVLFVAQVALVVEMERGKQKRWKLFERMNGCYYVIKITDILEDLTHKMFSAWRFSKQKVVCQMDLFLLVFLKVDNISKNCPELSTPSFNYRGKWIDIVPDFHVLFGTQRWKTVRKLNVSASYPTNHYRCSFQDLATCWMSQLSHVRALSHRFG